MAEQKTAKNAPEKPKPDASQPNNTAHDPERDTRIVPPPNFRERIAAAQRARAYRGRVTPPTMPAPPKPPKTDDSRGG